MFIGEKMKFERIVKFRLPFDKRHPEPSKNYGISALQIWFVLKKGQKAVQVMISTNSYLNSVIKEYQDMNMDLFTNENTYDCWDVGYHSNIKMYKNQKKHDCDILSGGKCYYDGSSLRGKTDKVAENFLEHGEEWVWKYLEEEWKIVFGGEE